MHTLVIPQLHRPNRPTPIIMSSVFVISHLPFCHSLQSKRAVETFAPSFTTENTQDAEIHRGKRGSQCVRSYVNFLRPLRRPPRVGNRHFTPIDAIGVEFAHTVRIRHIWMCRLLRKILARLEADSPEKSITCGTPGAHLQAA